MPNPEPRSRRREVQLAVPVKIPARQRAHPGPARQHRCRRKVCPAGIEIDEQLAIHWRRCREVRTAVAVQVRRQHAAQLQRSCANMSGRFKFSSVQADEHGDRAVQISHREIRLPIAVEIGCRNALGPLLEIVGSCQGIAHRNAFRERLKVCQQLRAHRHDA